MKTFITMALFAAILFTVAVSISSADSPPLVPNTFSGTVKFASSSGQFDAPVGTSVEALIDNVTKGSTTVITSGRYMIDVSGTDEDDGKDITFRANNLNAEQKAVFNASMPPPRIFNLIVNLPEGISLPASVTELRNISYAYNYINWTWTDPADSNFSKVMIYLDGGFRTNVSKGVQYYNATGLTSGTTHTISTRTVGTSGSINLTWVNHTATTNYSGETKGDVNGNGRRDTGDATLILRSIVSLPIPSQYLPILPIGDMNCNNRIDTGDATLVLRDVVNLPIPRCWE